MPTQISGDTGVSQIQNDTVTSAKIVAGAVTPADTQMGALPSCIQVNTPNGHGSTNTMIRRFTNTVLNQGSDITYADSATLGASFTINTNGVYAISYGDTCNSADISGISLNTTQPTVAIYLLTNASEALAMGVGTNGVSTATSCSWTGYLPAGSVVRAHTSGAATGLYPAATRFTITRVA